MRHTLFFIVFLFFSVSCSNKNSVYSKEVNKTYSSKLVTKEMINNLCKTTWIMKKKELYNVSSNGKNSLLPSDTLNVIKEVIFNKDFTIKNGKKAIIGNRFPNNLQFEIKGIDTISNYYGTYLLNQNKDLLLYSNVKFLKNNKVYKSYYIRILFQNKKLNHF